MNRLHRFFALLALLILLAPVGMLVSLSIGSGWSYPRLLPDRIDLLPWRVFFASRDGIVTALLHSTMMSLLVSASSTLLGLVAGRSLRKHSSLWLRVVAYIPFGVSPMVIGTCLYDLEVHLGVAGRMLGVVMAQFIFAFGFSTVLFCELWNTRTDRLESLVKELGGSRWSIWRHAIWPYAHRLIFVSLLQTALYSWLDYGLISVLGGGNVPSITLTLFSYIREGSVNQAAQSGLVLMLPPVVGLAVSMSLLGPRHDDEETN